MKPWGIVLLALLAWSPEADRALRLYREQPEQGLRAVQTAAFLLRRNQGPDSALALLDSAYALRPDARITRWALDLAFQGQDTQRLRRYLFRYPHEATQEAALSWVYLRLRNSRWRFLTAEWLDSVRTLLGHDPFGRQHYMEALQRRDFQEALRWLFVVAQQSHDLRWPLRELRRLAPFVDLEDARRILQALGNPREGQALLSRLYLLKGHREEAYRLARQARDPRVLLLLAREALAEAEVGEALRLLEAIPEKQRSPEAWLLLARTYRELGEPEQALQAYRRALPRGRREFLAYLLQTGRARQVPALADSGTLDLAAWAYVLLGDTARAESLTRQIPGARGEALRIRLSLLQGRVARADTLIRRYALHYPEDPWTAEALTLLDLLQTDPRLLPEIQRYLASGFPRSDTVPDTLSPNPAARFLRALAAENQGHLDQALGLYRELAEADTSAWAALALYRAGRLYLEAIGDTLQARTLWITLLQRFPKSPYAALARSALP